MSHTGDVDLGVVFALAFVVRALLVLRSRGGLWGNFGYDSGVYYSAADALIHGRMPYSGFLLLHPPALMVALTPFATLGTLTTDHLGFVVANVAFEILGAVNAVLVALVARRAGLSRPAALAGGCFYAVWLCAAGAEISIRLEPLGNFAFLLCVLLLLRARDSAWPGRCAVAAGAAFGVATDVKIWWVVPLLVVVAWTFLHRAEHRQAISITAGSIGAAALVAGPYFLHAPAVMWRMVVTDQLGRHSAAKPISSRLAALAYLGRSDPALHHEFRTITLVLLAALAVVVALDAWRIRPLRMIVLIAAGQLGVLLVAPSYFHYYSDYLAASASIVLAAAVGAASRTHLARAGAAAAIACIAVASLVTVVDAGLVENSTVTRFPGTRLAADVRHLNCVQSDSPMALIELDALSRDLSHGCPDWVDVTGRTYDVDAPPAGERIRRAANLRWQRDIARYLQSGDAEIVIRRDTGLSGATRAELDRLPVIARSRGYTVRRTMSSGRTWRGSGRTGSVGSVREALRWVTGALWRCRERPIALRLAALQSRHRRPTRSVRRLR